MGHNQNAFRFKICPGRAVIHLRIGHIKARSTSEAVSRGIQAVMSTACRKGWPGLVPVAPRLVRETPGTRTLPHIRRLTNAYLQQSWPRSPTARNK